MAAESTAPVPDVLIWLSRVGAQDAARLLIGCALDDGDSDEAIPIVALDAERKVVTLQGGRRVLLRAVRAGEVVDCRPDAPLVQAIANQWSAAERLEREENAELARAGIAVGRLASGEDRRAALAFLRKTARGELPGYGERHGFYLALRAGGDAGLARLGARMFAQLAERFEATGGVPDDLHWRRAWCLRSSGQLREAVAVSDVLHAGRVKDAGAQKVLATTRAGALLDLFEVTGEVKWLSLAERAAKVAYAIDPNGEEVSAVYRRFRTLRDRAGRER